MAAPRVVLPGDQIDIDMTKNNTAADQSTAKRVRLGPGLHLTNSSNVTAIKSGLLMTRGATDHWVDSNQKRATAVQGEPVIGTITALKGENYAVDIGTNLQATLSVFAFEGATKRNRPHLQVGDVVYARLSVANKDMEPELECIVAGGKSGGLGQLTDGIVFSCPLSLCRRLLKPDCPILTKLGARIKFEICAGTNGRVWVKAETVSQTILVKTAIETSQYLAAADMDKFVNKLVKSLKE